MAQILIVDDDPSMLSFLSSALENAGHTITSKDNGLCALEALEENTEFSLLLTDIVMPGMDGVELANKAKRLYPNLKTMFITGFSVVALRQTLGNNAPDNKSNVMAKPFHLKDLVSRVEAILAD